MQTDGDPFQAQKQWRQRHPLEERKVVALETIADELQSVRAAMIEIIALLRADRSSGPPGG